MATAQRRTTAPDPLALGIGSVLHELKTLRGVNGVQLAEMSGKTQSQISRWENGKAEISVSDLSVLCDVLDIELGDFMAEAKRRATVIAGGFTASSDSSTTPPK